MFCDNLMNSYDTMLQFHARQIKSSKNCVYCSFIYCSDQLKPAGNLWILIWIEHSRHPSFLSCPPETAGRVLLSLDQCHKPTGWLPCLVCFSGGRLGPEAGWWSAGPQCCRALKDTGSVGPPSSPGRLGSCRGGAPQLAGSLRIRGHLLEAPGKKRGMLRED